MKKTDGEKRRDFYNSVLLLSQEILSKDCDKWTFAELTFIRHLNEIKHEFLRERRELAEMYPVEVEINRAIN
ncbi:hypothetical protein ACFO25_10020 [Paenactinomyces guangxiensis]|uniref:Uncharacterized protein n=1 Tax=Paenactinomyces guangxiensis TaxID=1490290 RepID=A0A7W2A816_9BACL|nr:hypothetical protein [Paenactinomyces guangxiensis]MBA4495121.1 hypothetical protein [Paenactinomyces guangxiensis]MBH8592195.1 hypothetical protein [Paenactinomyces guangxiensis]